MKIGVFNGVGGGASFVSPQNACSTFRKYEQILQLK